MEKYYPFGKKLRMGPVLSFIALPFFECALCMTCSIAFKLLDWSLSQMTRFGHLSIFIVIFALSVISGEYYAPYLIDNLGVTKSQIGLSCLTSSSKHCMLGQLISRASFALVIFYLTMALLTSLTSYVDKHLWLPKFFVAIATFISLFWAKDEFFYGWSEICRYISFLWMLFQSIILLDFAHYAHEYIINKADEAESKHGDNGGRMWYGIYLVISFGSLIATTIGLSFLFTSYTGCQLGMFFTLLTLLFGLSTNILSLLNFINTGLLAPSIIFSYSTFLCW